MPILRYTNEIRSAVLMIHGEKAHSCYFSKDAFADMVNGNPYRENKECCSFFRMLSIPISMTGKTSFLLIKSSSFSVNI